MAKTTNQGTNNANSNATQPEPTTEAVADNATAQTVAVEQSPDTLAQEAIDDQAIMLGAFLRQVPATRAGLMSFNWHDKAAEIVKAIKGIDIPRKGDNGKGLNGERRRLGDVCRAIGGGYWSNDDDKRSDVVSKVCSDFAAKFHGEGSKGAQDCLTVCRAIVVAVLEGRKLTSNNVIVTPKAVDEFKALLAAK